MAARPPASPGADGSGQEGGRMRVQMANHAVRGRLLRRCRAAGLSPGAPLESAERVAGDALAAGASVDGAVEDGWAYLLAWMAHPSGSAARA